MILSAAAAAGMGLGLAYFAVLWLTVHRAACGAWGPRRMAASTAIRVGVAGGAFYGFTQLGAGAALAALTGFIVARSIWTGIASRGMTTVQNGN